MQICKYCGRQIKYERVKYYYRVTGEFAGYSGGSYYGQRELFGFLIITSDMCFTFKHGLKFHKPI